MDKYDYIRFTAKLLAEKGSTMFAIDLVYDLNERKYKTNRGGDFVGEEGIYKLISSTYHRLANSGKQEDAENVARAFTKPDGDYAFD